MKATSRTTILMLIMIIASGMACALHPTHKIADDGEKVNFEAMIPKQFGDWKLLPVARMKRSGIRDVWGAAFPDSASLHPGYELLKPLI